MRNHDIDGDVRVDEDPGVAHHLDRVRERDAAAAQSDASGPADDASPTQDRPLLAQSAATREQEIEGIVAQTASDGLSPSEVVRALRRRFLDAGIDIDADELDDLAERVLEHR